MALAAASVLQAIWIGLFAREIGPFEFGFFGLVFALGTIAGGVFGFGFGSYALRLGTLSGTHNTISTMLAVRTSTVLLIGASGLIVGGTIGGVRTEVLVCALLAVCSEMIGELVQGILSGQRRHARAAWVLVLQRSLPLAGLMLGSIYGQVESGLAIGLATGTVVPMLAMYSYLSRPAHIARTIGDARHFWSASVVANISQLEIPLVGAVSGGVIAGYYTSANRVSNPVNIVTSALLNVLVPEMTSTETPGRRFALFKRARNLAVGLALLLSVASYPIAVAAVWFLGPDYSQALPFLIAFVVAAAISGVSRIYQALLFAENRAKAVTWSIVAGSAAGLGAIVLAGSLVGPGAVWIGPVVAQVAILLAFVVSIRRPR